VTKKYSAAVVLASVGLVIKTDALSFIYEPWVKMFLSLIYKVYQNARYIPYLLFP